MVLAWARAETLYLIHKYRAERDRDTERDGDTKRDRGTKRRQRKRAHAGESQLGMVGAFEISKPTPSDTPPPARPSQTLPPTGNQVLKYVS